MKPTLLILAAGMGSRYGGLKQVDPVGPNGEAIIDYSIFDAIRAGYGKVVFVIRESFAGAFKESFETKLVGKIKTEYVFQELNSFIPDNLNIHPDRVKPWGTGHAVLVAKNIIREPFVVINADDYYGPDAYWKIPEFLINSETAGLPNHCMVGYELRNTLSEHGHVSRGVCQTDQNEFLKTVVERTHIVKKNGKIISRLDDGRDIELTGDEVVSMNIWGFLPSFMDHLDDYFQDFIKENAGNLKGEFYIPFVVNDLIEKGKINLKVFQSKDLWFGVTYKEDKEAAVGSINRLIEKGVYPEKLWN
ncbi:MAG: nucleotidyltransferase [Bacteroidales bacterium]|nr:nucleotidyltransferase [Bacteroidales bacterium]